MPAGTDNHPVVLVDFFQAHLYCAAHSQRLPTESEWELAARGVDGYLWPWGDEVEPNNANYGKHNESGIATTGVSEFSQGQSPYGLFNMAGNVWEWVSSDYKPYPDASPSVLAEIESLDLHKVSRGGSWDTNSVHDTRTFVRNHDQANAREPTVGFRCARDAGLRPPPTPFAETMPVE